MNQVMLDYLNRDGSYSMEDTDHGLFVEHIDEDNTIKGYVSRRADDESVPDYIMAASEGDKAAENLKLVAWAISAGYHPRGVEPELTAEYEGIIDGEHRWSFRYKIPSSLGMIERR